MNCSNHNPVQHRDGAEPWCDVCGKNLAGEEPTSIFDGLKKYQGERPNWDQYGLEMARTSALRADCTRRKVGASLMLEDHSIVVSGYNGGPSKGPSCLAGECPRGRLSHDELPADSVYDTGGGTCVALHAEWNVLLRASWEQMLGSTLYITEEPCHICKNLIAGTGIWRVVWPDNEWFVRSNHTQKLWPKF